MARVSVACIICFLAATAYAGPMMAFWGKPSATAWQSYVKIKTVMLGPAGDCDNSYAMTSLIPIHGETEADATCVNQTISCDGCDKKDEKKMKMTMFRSVKVWSGPDGSGVASFYDDACKTPAAFPTKIPVPAGNGTMMEVPTPDYMKMFEAMMAPPDYKEEVTCKPDGEQVADLDSAAVEKMAQFVGMMYGADLNATQLAALTADVV